MSGFNNPVAGGGGTLVRAAIKSPNYVTASAGWIIRQDGTAEFTGVTVSGDITGSTITGSTITGSAITGGSIAGTTITGGTFQTAASGKRIIITGASADEVGRIRWFSGEAAEQQPAYISVGPPSPGLPNALHIRSPQAAGDYSYLSLETADPRAELWAPGGISLLTGPDDLGVVVGGELVVSSTSGQNGYAWCSDFGWSPISLAAGYSWYADGEEPAWQFLTPTVIELRGAIQKGTGAGGAGANGFGDGNQPFVLPVGARPVSRRHFAVAAQARAGSPGTAQINIGSAGVCNFRDSGGFAPGWVALDNIIFDTV